MKTKIQLLKVLASASYMLGVASLITALVYSLSPAVPTFAQSGAGAIWTTSNTCGDPQNLNQYEVGDTIFINGANFTAGVSLSWDITRVSGGSEKPTVASGTVTVDSSGAFCFSAYLILLSDAGYTYQATVGTVKSDNFRVAAADPTATFTPSSTPTDTPTATPTNTAVPSSTPTDTPTATPTNTSAPSSTPTDTPIGAPTNTPVPSSTPTDTPIGAPTNTPVPSSTPTDTPEPTATETPTSTPEDPGNPSDPTSTPTSTPTPTATSVPPSATPANPGPSPTQTLSGIDLVTDPGLLIPVTGADATGGPLSRTTLFKNLGVFLFGFGLVLHGLYLQAKKSK